jgi:putative N-acetyltransferase (TIGR04045 family)
MRNKSKIQNQISAIVCRQVKSEGELEDCYRIRKQVFVEEQNLFARTDRDRYDKRAIHIAAFQGGRIIGTVRIYEEGRGIWFGGRLAVLKDFRGRAGRLLIEKAVEIAQADNAKRFFAYIQVRNVLFFKRCGWSKAGEVFNYHGVPHQLMEAELKKGFNPPSADRGQGFR